MSLPARAGLTSRTSGTCHPRRREAPVDDFSRSIDLEQVGVRRSPLATFIDYGVAG
jgi:hypothetical protein